MIHIRAFVQDYWVALTGTAVWLLFMASCGLIPDRLTYLYEMLWAGAASLVALFFVLGYIRFSKPSKDPVTRKRAWQGEWAWILSQATVVVLVVGLAFVLRFLNRDAAPLTEERVMQYRATASVFVIVFFEQLWITWLWTARQIHTRRALREARAG